MPRRTSRNTDPELLDTFRAAFERYFGAPHVRQSRTGAVTQLRLTKAELLALEPYLGALATSEAKTIPDRLVNASAVKIARFLGLYFCGDGWADRSGAHFGTKSPHVAKALKRMLLRFGIVANVCSRQIAGHGRHYTVSVADKGHAKAFARLVDPHLTAIKLAKVERWLVHWADVTGAGVTNVGIPTSFVREEFARRQAVTGRSKRRLGIDGGGLLNTRLVHRRTLDGLLYSERLEDLRTGDLVWDTVVSVERVRDAECFDFRMASEERPYAVVEDFLVHNCGKKDRRLIAMERAKFVEGCEATGYGAALGTTAVRHHRAVRRLRLQQEPRLRLRPGRLPDRLPQGSLPCRVPRQPAHQREGDARQGRGVHRRVPGDGDPAC